MNPEQFWPVSSPSCFTILFTLWTLTSTGPIGAIECRETVTIFNSATTRITKQMSWLFSLSWPQSTYFMNKHFCNISICICVWMYTYVTYVDINLYLRMWGGVVSGWMVTSRVRAWWTRTGWRSLTGEASLSGARIRKQSQIGGLLHLWHGCSTNISLLKSLLALPFSELPKKQGIKLKRFDYEQKIEILRTFADISAEPY